MAKFKSKSRTRRDDGREARWFDPRQLLLFGKVIEEKPLDEGQLEQEAGQPLVTRRAKNRHNHGRGPVLASLPRIEIELELAEEYRMNASTE